MENTGSGSPCFFVKSFVSLFTIEGMFLFLQYVYFQWLVFHHQKKKKGGKKEAVDIFLQT